MVSAAWRRRTLTPPVGASSLLDQEAKSDTCGLQGRVRLFYSNHSGMGIDGNNRSKTIPEWSVDYSDETTRLEYSV